LCTGYFRAAGKPLVNSQREQSLQGKIFDDCDFFQPRCRIARHDECHGDALRPSQKLSNVPLSHGWYFYYRFWKTANRRAVILGVKDFAR